MLQVRYHTKPRLREDLQMERFLHVTKNQHTIKSGFREVSFLPSLKMPRFSQRLRMQLKSRTRCLILVLLLYIVFCLLLVTFPNPSHLQATSMARSSSDYQIPEQFQQLNADRNKSKMSPSLFGQEESKAFGEESGFYIIQNHAKCHHTHSKQSKNETTSHPKKQILIFVASKPENVEARNVIRNTWAKEPILNEYEVIVLFLVGMKNSHDNKENISRLIDENSQFNDLVVGNFEDHYRSMTLKTKMGFHWFVWNCPSASFIVKSDDDVYIVYSNLYKALSTVQPVSIFGYCTNNRTFVTRNPRDVAYVSYFDWTEPTVPRYCFGMAYGMDNYVAKIVYQTSSKIPQFPLEDIFVGIAIEASKIRIKFQYLNRNYSLHADQSAFGLSYCNRRYSIAFHQLNPSEMELVYNQFKKAAKSPSFCDQDLETRLKRLHNGDSYE